VCKAVGRRSVRRPRLTRFRRTGPRKFRPSPRPFYTSAREPREFLKNARRIGHMPLTRASLCFFRRARALPALSLFIATSHVLTCPNGLYICYFSHLPPSPCPPPPAAPLGQNPRPRGDFPFVSKHTVAGALSQQFLLPPTCKPNKYSSCPSSMTPAHFTFRHRAPMIIASSSSLNYHPSTLLFYFDHVHRVLLAHFLQPIAFNTYQHVRPIWLNSKGIRHRVSTVRVNPFSWEKKLKFMAKLLKRVTATHFLQ
jgi:hypothetical protein